MGTQAGVELTAAIRNGVSVAELRRRRRSGTKRCMRCKPVLPDLWFSKDRQRYDGLNPSCFKCKRKAFREWWAKRKSDAE